MRRGAVPPRGVGELGRYAWESPLSSNAGTALDAVSATRSRDLPSGIPDAAPNAPRRGSVTRVLPSDAVWLALASQLPPVGSAPRRGPCRRVLLRRRPPPRPSLRSPRGTGHGPPLISKAPRRLRPPSPGSRQSVAAVAWAPLDTLPPAPPLCSDPAGARFGYPF